MLKRVRVVGLAVSVLFLCYSAYGDLNRSPQSSSDARDKLSTSPARLSEGSASRYDYSRIETRRPEYQLLEPTKALREYSEKMSFAGVKMVQIPNDIWAFQEVIVKTRPDTIIETGTLYGGSSLFFASVLDLINEEAKVITVDIRPRVGRASKFDLFAKTVRVIRGDSVSSEVIDRVDELIENDDKVLVTLDSLHSKEHVAEELELYSRFVSVDSYLIVQDTFFRGLPEAIDEFLAEHQNFELDPTYEQKYRFTKNRGGFLKRTR